MASRAVERIGRYQVLDEVGRGAMGVVYRAQDPAIGRVVAIKTIRLTDLTDPSERDRLRERLFREAQSAGVLSHPNIVTIYDVAEENGLAYIFMEFVSGPPLEKLLASTEAPANELALSILGQTAAALDYAHSRGIVHRDIKPANILMHDLTPGGAQAKITDFGVAKILSQEMTLSGSIMGTPNYMSPEQVQGHAVDGRADQFSLAVIAYEILTGEKPFLGDYLPTLLYKIVREDPAPPERLNPSLGPAVDGVLAKGLGKTAEQRYATCAQFVAALTEALRASPGWKALPRGTSQSLPTLAGTARAAEGPRGKAAAAAPLARTAEREEQAGSPLLKSLAWMLAGIGLLGLVLLLGAQRFLFNHDGEPGPAAPPAANAQPQASPTLPGEGTEAKPSPVGDGREAAGAERDAAGEAAARAASRTAPGAGSAVAEGETGPPGQAARPGDRTIQFVTDPPGAQLSIDGAAAACQTPCMLALQPGRHVLNARAEGYKPYPRVFNVPQDSDVFLQLARLQATLSITSTPPGASIEINGVDQHKRTPATLNLEPGAYRVRVMRDGVPLDFEVALKDGEFISKNVSF